VKKPTKKKGAAKMMPGAKAPSGSGDKMINRMGGGKVTDRGVKK